MAAAHGLSSDTFMQVVEALKDDPVGLLGAARLLHGHLKLPQKKSLEWELRLAEITLAKGYPDNFRTVVESLARHTEPAAWEFLRKLAAGEVSVREWAAVDDIERDSDLNRKEPNPRAHAILQLARHGDESAKLLAAKFEATKPSELDQAALEIAHGFMGEAGSVKRRHFSTHSSIIIKMAFEALEKQGDRDALELVVDQASTHSNWRLIPDEAVRSAQRMTGVKFYPDVGPPPSQYADDLRTWWEKNRETFKKPQ